MQTCERLSLRVTSVQYEPTFTPVVGKLSGRFNGMSMDIRVCNLEVAADLSGPEGCIHIEFTLDHHRTWEYLLKTVLSAAVSHQLTIANNQLVGLKGAGGHVH